MGHLLAWLLSKSSPNTAAVARTTVGVTRMNAGTADNVLPDTGYVMFNFRLLPGQMTLCCAALRCAVLCCAALCCAVLCCAVLRCETRLALKQKVTAGSSSESTHVYECLSYLQLITGDHWKSIEALPNSRGPTIAENAGA